MQPINLSLVASRILNCILLYGETFLDLPVRYQMDAVSTTRIQSYREARGELERKGFVELVTHPGLETRMVVSGTYILPINVLYAPSPNGSIQAQVDNNHHQNGHAPLTESVWLPLTESVTPNTIRYGLPLTESVEGSSIPLTESGSTNRKCLGLLDECRLVDEMDDSGDIMVRNSPIQKRRKAQVPLIQRAYSEAFHQDTYPLTEKMAREWLGLNENNAVQVVEALNEIAHLKPDLESPKAYISVTFRKTSERSIKPSPPADLPAPKVFDGELVEPSPEFLEKKRRAIERARKLYPDD